MRVFITGAEGFIGGHLVEELKSRNIDYVSGARKMYGDISKRQDWKEFLTDIDVVVHLAARVHVMKEVSENPLSVFREMNVNATMNLARDAKKLGVKRFIYISSIKVNGEETGEIAYSAKDEPHPQDPYGISKMEAERELMKLHEKNVFEVVIIRPPLVYGPGVKANLERLFALVEKHRFIPFRNVNNKRSFVSVFNLCDLIILCLDHPRAGGEVFLATDGVEYSLRELIELIASILGKRPYLIPIPVSLMRIMFSLVGKKIYSNRLFGNLHLDITKTKELLNWKPTYDFKKTFEAKSSKI